MSTPVPDPRDPKATHERDQRETRAADMARECACFYQTLRKQGVPATAASAMAESYVAALVAGDLPREPWQS